MIDRYGWSMRHQQQFHVHAAQGLVPARVTVQRRGTCQIITEDGERTTRLSGR